jgi:hypothetical protein
MLKLACRRSPPPSRRVQIFTRCVVFPRRRQSTKAKPHSSKNHHSPLTPSRYPFPTHLNPTPFQIFHLPTNASSEVIKARCIPTFPLAMTRSKCWPPDYELVKLYHPDVVAASLSQAPPLLREEGGTHSTSSKDLTPEIAQARFQAVTKAYDSLRKGKAKGKAHLGADLFADVAQSRMSARRRRELRARAELRVGDDDKWRERLIVGALIAVSCILVYMSRRRVDCRTRCRRWYSLCIKHLRRGEKDWLLPPPQILGQTERESRSKRLLHRIPHKKIPPPASGANR